MAHKALREKFFLWLAIQVLDVGAAPGTWTQ
jgi:23S rRNA U2552 (ribose-2'-O)-methylase RlmE/FtsJ